MSSKSKSTAQPAHPSTEDHDHHDHDERPHVCNDGWVTLERVMNLGENRIEMRIPRSPWFPCDLRFRHS
jgi:hypothetical protein